MTQKKAKAIITDKKALDKIAEIMSGEEWDSETLETIAALVNYTGRPVRDISEEDPDAD